MFPMIPFVPYLSRSGGRRGCGVENCKCFCHRDHWYENPFVYVLSILGAAALFIWALMTLLMWADPIGHEPLTLVQVLADEWHWLVDLLHRVY